MGFIDKVKGIVNPEEEEYTEDYEDTYADDQAYDDQYAQQEQPGTTFGGFGSALELKVVRPEKFESVTQIADHLVSKRTVVLNLEATNKETARRMIDFLSGVAYAMQGNLKKVAANTYVITPDNVAVSNDQVASASQPQQAPAQAPANVYSNL